jgi:hypothetical protein
LELRAVQDMKRHLCLGSIGMLWVLIAFAEPPASEPSIPFANVDGIRDWSADGTKGIYIQSRNGQWYHASFMALCIDLPYAEHVGFVTEPGSGSFNRFSSITVHGQRCPVKTFAQSEPPRSKARHPTSSPASSSATSADAPAKP